jgi:hypothetical protein
MPLHVYKERNIDSTNDFPSYNASMAKHVSKEQRNPSSVLFSDATQRTELQSEFDKVIRDSINGAIPNHIMELPSIIEDINQLTSETEVVLEAMSLKESEVKPFIEKYLLNLDDSQRQSFAPLDLLMKHALGGMDLHLLTLKETSRGDVIGLAVFNIESHKVVVQGKTKLKAVMHHFSCFKKDLRERLLDQAMSFIWNHTHCSAIRVNLFHFKENQDGQLRADPEIKAILKKKMFKWKTVQNDVVHGHRSEILEVANMDHQLQMSRTQATIFREGQKMEDILKEPLQVRIVSLMSIGDQRSEKVTLASQTGIQSHSSII